MERPVIGPAYHNPISRLSLASRVVIDALIAHLSKHICTAEKIKNEGIRGGAFVPKGTNL